MKQITLLPTKIPLIAGLAFGLIFSSSLSARDFRAKSAGDAKVGSFKAKTLDVVYVDNQSSPGGTGTKSNPVDTIQDGVDVAFSHGAQTVVVRGGGAAYTGDVTVQNPRGLKIYGDGVDISTKKENPYAGKGDQPVLEGGFYVENIPFFTLMGLTIFDGFAGEDGVEIVDVERAQVTGNRIYGTGEGALFAAAILLWATDDHVGDFTVSCNQVAENAQTAIALFAIDDAEVITTITKNNLLRNAAVGLKLSLHDASVGKIKATDNSISSNTVFVTGISGRTADSAEGSFEIAGNDLQFVGHSAITLFSTGDSKAEFLVTKNTVKNSRNGAAIGAGGTSDANVVFSNNTLTNNEQGGLRVISSTFGITTIKIEGNQVDQNGDYGFNFVENDFGIVKVEGKVNNQTLAGNNGNEVEFTGGPNGSFVLNGKTVVLPVMIP